MDYYSYIWLEEPIVSGLISHSGTAFLLSPKSQDEARMRFYQASANVGCGDSGNVLDCHAQQKPSGASRRYWTDPTSP